MPALSMITHVYNSQASVDHHLALWKDYSQALRDSIEFIVIDDFSTPELVIDRGPLNLRHFRVDDDIDWNMPGCRNLAAITASSPWMLYFDADNVIPPEQLSHLVAALGTLDERTLYVFRRIHDGEEVDPHINSFLISRKGFFRAGGYDEDFAGHYGFEDVLFRNMWRTHTGREVLLTDIQFQQMSWRTSDLDRDTSRNEQLIANKAAANFPKPQAFLRFNWHEV